MSEGGKWKAVLGLGCISHREASLSKDLEEVREWAPRVSGKSSAGRGHAGKGCRWREPPGSRHGWSGVSLEAREGCEGGSRAEHFPVSPSPVPRWQQFLFKSCFGCSRFFAFLYEFWNQLFNVYSKIKTVGNLIGITLNYRLIWGEMTSFDP